MEPLVVNLDGQIREPLLEAAPGKLTEAIEAIEESRVCRQVSENKLDKLSAEASMQPGLNTEGLATVATASSQTAPQLAGNGCYDHLLQPGCAHDLSRHLAEIFRDDPPIDCGRTNGRTAGLSCAYGAKYGQEVFSISAVMQLLLVAKTFWDPRPCQNLLRISVAAGARLIIVGDTHGQLVDVLWMFFKYGLPSRTNQYLFNGDIVDRGGHALEIFLLLFSFKRDCPESVHMLRGNHEDAMAILYFGFKAELESKFPDYLGCIWKIFTQLIFPLMPIVSLVSDMAQQRQFCVVHGGIPSSTLGLNRPATIENDLARINRLRPSLKNLHDADIDGRILYSFLWADPVDNESDNAHTRSRLAGRFSESETREFCEHNQVSFLVRSHQVPRTLRGVIANHDGLCYTVFSASNYSGSAGNLGGVLLCSGEPLEIQASEHYAPSWAELAELLPNNSEAGFYAAEDVRLRIVQGWEEQFGIKDTVAKDDAGLGFKFVWDWLWQQLSPKASPKTACFEAARAQMNQFMTERIIEHKEQLFYHFNCVDVGCTGLLAKDDWSDVVFSILGSQYPDVVSRSTLEELFVEWRLTAPVQYVQFLHRFQIRDDSGNGSVLVDRIKVISQLQARLVDFSSLNLEQLLDPNDDKVVTHQEFAMFLPHFHIEIPPWQGAALYETMAGMMCQNPLTLDATIICLALASQRSISLVDDPWSETAEAIGREILTSGQTFTEVFKSWDSDNDGFLSLSELEQGLKSLPLTQGITHDQAKSCMARIESTGVLNEQISIFEFVRAVASHELTLALQQSLIMEALKLVWVCRPTLLSYLAHMDPEATSVVSLEQFHSCILQINTQLQGMGQYQLTDIQIGAICEIAAAGRETVRYADFIRGLHVEDTLSCAV